MLAWAAFSAKRRIGRIPRGGSTARSWDPMAGALLAERRVAGIMNLSAINGRLNASGKDSKRRTGEDVMAVKSRETAKELKCLFGIAEVLVRKDLSIEDILRGVVEHLPEGFQHPEICRVRIKMGDDAFASPGFEETPWTLKAHLVAHGKLIGSLEAVYLENQSLYGESPFLLDEKKLVEIVAQKLSQSLELSRNGKAGVRAPEPVRHETAESRKPDWQAILDLIRETDGSLHKRILRRLMNHLTKLGVPGVQELIVQFDPAIYAERERDSRGSNQPLPKRDFDFLNKLFDEIIRVASITLGDEELAVLIKQWIRQDKMGFFAMAIEKRDISLTEISELVSRFCRDTREGEPMLSPADAMNVRVALARRFLSDNLKFIGVAKQYLTIHDFGRILTRVAGPAQGNGKLGGKGSGLILATHILQKKAPERPLLEKLKVPLTWHLTSDGLFDFVHYNSLEDLQSFKFSSLEEVRHNFPYLEQVFKHSFFSQEMVQQLKIALDELGEGPLIVRSSSLLEDSEGTAFSGKYRSLFLPNTGTKEERLEALKDAVSEVYSSIFGPDPIQYRAERGLLDFMEEMGILIQRVVGKRVGKYFFPAFSGVAFSNNEFRWSPRIKREDGVLRIVTGLGTRAVDRIGDDFPVLVCPAQPELRVNVTPDQVLHYAQKYMDVLNLETGRFESPSIDEILKEVGDEFPYLEKVFSIYREGSLRKPMLGMADPALDDLVVTFAGLIENTDFVKQMREILSVLQDTIGSPVDVEFAHDGEDLYLLQCRPQSRMGEDVSVTIPHWVSQKHKIFTANRYVTNAVVTGIRYIVYVDPDGYNTLPSTTDMAAVADAVSRLNSILPRRSFILMGPGRWGSRGDITLGVGVTYSGISNTQMLIEIAKRKGSYVPDLSFGTHFFQDLVEAKIRYLALYPDEEGVLFREDFFKSSPNILEELLPEYADLKNILRVIDVPQATGGCHLEVLMDGEKEQALGYLVEKESTPPT